ncbi:acyl-CoA thioesterase domain-containing protein [Cupriavidus lacunae]|uniref:Acyl-CoA thioesterase-like N-terminal HotDog domain-containing protein n=1 Tax=Cupriavidus lacunae TaxID=2666307 RepID=A0A370P0Q8_9BURK|nr:acyl-CoA thioesterase domain-containing protein [Cupriavidus lacunae]RDK11451.1 hypothetical protein DN412_03550 [Cupriavidus lacunae]
MTLVLHERGYDMMEQSRVTLTGSRFGLDASIGFAAGEGRGIGAVVLNAAMHAAMHGAVPVSVSLQLASPLLPGVPVEVVPELTRGNAGLQFWKLELIQEGDPVGFASVVLECLDPSISYVPWGKGCPVPNRATGVTESKSVLQVTRACEVLQDDLLRIAGDLPTWLFIRYHARATAVTDFTSLNRVVKTVERGIFTTVEVEVQVEREVVATATSVYFKHAGD